MINQSHKANKLIAACELLQLIMNYKDCLDDVTRCRQVFFSLKNQAKKELKTGRDIMANLEIFKSLKLLCEITLPDIAQVTELKLVNLIVVKLE